MPKNSMASNTFTTGKYTALATAIATATKI